MPDAPDAETFTMRIGDRLVRVRIEDVGPAPAATLDDEIAELAAMVESLHAQVRQLRAERLAEKHADAPLVSRRIH